MGTLRTLLASLTFFEAASLLAYYLQLTLIGGGLLMMHRAGRRRDRQLDIMQAQSEATLWALVEQTRALEESIRSLVEQNREQSRALGNQNEALEELLRRTG